MAINYNKTTWVNGQAPAINATNLNKIENGIKSACDGVDNTYSKTEIDAMFVTEQISAATGSINANSGKIGTADATKAGYKAIGILGVSGGGSVIPVGFYTDSDDVLHWAARNITSSAASATFIFYVLYKAI